MGETFGGLQKTIRTYAYRGAGCTVGEREDRGHLGLIDSHMGAGRAL